MAKQQKKKIEDYYDAPQTLEDHQFYGFKLDEKQKYYRDCIWNPDKKIIFCNAAAGTGKTLMAFATANLLVKYGLYDGIIYVVSPYGEAKQGFLPGDITEKSEVYFEPLYQAIIKCNEDPSHIICDEALTAKSEGSDVGYVKCLTHTFLRGTNFEKKVVILDETQNFGFDDLKKVLTRPSDDCKIIVIGHNEQKDTDDEYDAFVNYLNYYKEMEDNGEVRVAICELTENHRGWISSTADKLPKPKPKKRETDIPSPHDGNAIPIPYLQLTPVMPWNPVEPYYDSTAVPWWVAHKVNITSSTSGSWSEEK